MHCRPAVSPTNLLDDPIFLGRRPTSGKEIVQRFFGRSQSTDAFAVWIGDEFLLTSTIYD